MVMGQVLSLKEERNLHALFHTMERKKIRRGRNKKFKKLLPNNSFFSHWDFFCPT